MRSASPVVAQLVAVALAGAGCATFAQKPPTPADDIPADVARTAIAPPGERYFLLVFGSQSSPKRPKYTHTWATLVRATGCGGPGEPAVEEHTISWMPASLDIKPLARRPEPGANLGLHFTVEEMLRHDERVSVWGPYEVGPAFYQRFLVQKQFLESGRIGYQCIDAVGEAGRLGTGCDCIHAFTDMDPQFDRTEYPLTRFGDAGSRNIVRQLHGRPIIIGPCRDHGWLLPRLGLDRYPITRQTYCGPVVENTPENVEAYLRKSCLR
jgi:hypothetical protein